MVCIKWKVKVEEPSGCPVCQGLPKVCPTGLHHHGLPMEPASTKEEAHSYWLVTDNLIKPAEDVYNGKQLCPLVYLDCSAV